MDYRRFSRSILSEMHFLAWSNIHGVMPEEREFWLVRLNAIEVAQRSAPYEDPDFSRTVSGTGRSAPEPPDPDDPSRDVQTRVSKVDTSHRTFGRSLDRKTAQGARSLGLRLPPRKVP